MIIEKDDSHTYLRVQDDGPGVPKEFRNRLFERFFRVYGTQASGSGLGLAIVSQICQLHQAEVSLGDGIDGKGLEFKITFKNDPFAG